ncbi:hypothetical protein [Streptomyces sp. NPDC051677]|uniref:hypothetical protein n=1 Tax=Streptomyces sp. NPDC051677 TaxID=3365669 RepID=UPI0037D48911
MLMTMDDRPSLQGVRPPPSVGAAPDASGQSGVIGIALAAVLTAAFAQGSWQWFATYIGVTLLAVIFSYYRPPTWTPGLASVYMRSTAAFSLVVGLCVAITLAPVLQRSAWLFPMPGTRRGCPETGRYEGIQAEAALANLVGRDKSALAHAQQARIHEAVADCLSATTTLWLPAYAFGVAALVALTMWYADRARTRRNTAAAASLQRR